MKKSKKNFSTKETLKSLWNKITYLFFRFKHMSFIKHIFIVYFLTIIIGACFLYLPFSHNGSINFMDAFFTAASSFSDTGLVTVKTASTWTTVGQGIIAFLILVGGVGWIALKVYIFNIIFRKPISYQTSLTLSSERGSNRIGFSVHIIKVSVTILITVLFISIIGLTTYFYFVKPDLNPYQINNYTSDQALIESLSGESMISSGVNPYYNFENALSFGVFHAISAVNNSGFDIIGANSFAPYYSSYGIQIILILLFVLGGIGYPAIYDIYGYIRSKIKKTPFRWSVFTKLSMTVYAIVTIIGLGTTFIIETQASNTFIINQNQEVYSFWNNPMYGNTSQKTMAIFFNTFSTRNAGFATVRISDFSSPTLFIYIILMFIGSAPSSTAGGIRTTTLGIVCLGIWNKLRGRDEVRMLKSRIPSKTVEKSYIVLAVAILIVAVASLISISSLSTEGGQMNSSYETSLIRLANNNSVYVDRYDYQHLLFEVSSAFGTTGLSTGITTTLSIYSKIVLIIIMFFGQFGISSTILVWSSRAPKTKNFKLVKEDVITG